MMLQLSDKSLGLEFSSVVSAYFLGISAKGLRLALSLTGCDEGLLLWKLALLLANISQKLSMFSCSVSRRDNFSELYLALNKLTSAFLRLVVPPRPIHIAVFILAVAGRGVPAARLASENGIRLGGRKAVFTKIL
jgi:hypothetical protein